MKLYFKVHAKSRNTFIDYAHDQTQIFVALNKTRTNCLWKFLAEKKTSKRETMQIWLILSSIFNHDRHLLFNLNDRNLDWTMTIISTIIEVWEELANEVISDFRTIFHYVIKLDSQEQTNSAERNMTRK